MKNVQLFLLNRKKLHNKSVPFFTFPGVLVLHRIITLDDLWINELKADNFSLGQRFIKTFLIYCTQNIGPSFTRDMWLSSTLKFSDFMEENEIENFIKTNVNN